MSDHHSTTGTVMTNPTTTMSAGVGGEAGAATSGGQKQRPHHNRGESASSLSQTSGTSSQSRSRSRSGSDVGEGAYPPPPPPAAVAASRNNNNNNNKTTTTSTNKKLILNAPQVYDEGDSQPLTVVKKQQHQQPQRRPLSTGSARRGESATETSVSSSTASPARPRSSETRKQPQRNGGNGGNSNSNNTGPPTATATAAAPRRPTASPGKMGQRKTVETEDESPLLVMATPFAEAVETTITASPSSPPPPRQQNMSGAVVEIEEDLSLTMGGGSSLDDGGGSKKSGGTGTIARGIPPPVIAAKGPSSSSSSSRHQNSHNQQQQQQRAATAPSAPLEEYEKQLRREREENLRSGGGSRRSLNSGSHHTNDPKDNIHRGREIETYPHSLSSNNSSSKKTSKRTGGRAGGGGGGRHRSRSRSHSRTRGGNGSEQQIPATKSSMPDSPYMAAIRKESMKESPTKHVIKNIIIIFLSLIVIILAVVYSREKKENDTNVNNSDGSGGSGGSGGGGGSNGDGNGNNTTNGNGGLLDIIRNRGVLHCGIPNDQKGFAVMNFNTNQYEGFDVDLCRAVAAAIFGVVDDNNDDESKNNVIFTPLDAFTRFTELQEGRVDLLARVTTHTMERDLNEATTGAGFSFSIPYLYNGLQLAGIPEYVKCADQLNTTGTICGDLKICALDGSTHVDELQATSSSFSIVSVISPSQLYSYLRDEKCNVIAGEQYDVAESVVRTSGYVGDFEMGTKILSKEPLALVTRDDDPRWSDFVNWVMDSLIAAEEQGITSANAELSAPLVPYFGTQYTQMFRNAIRAVGNFGEMYRRNLEPILPRPVAETINGGNSGMIYALPFGNLARPGPGPLPGGTLGKVLGRGYLICGIQREIMFAQVENEDSGSPRWSGFDVDYCKALSAAIFDGDTDSIEYREVIQESRFSTLAKGNIDVLARYTDANLQFDVKEPGTGQGFTFSQPYYFAGLTFGGVPPYGECADSMDFQSTRCQNLKICVTQDTPFESRIRSLFPQPAIVATRQALPDTLMSGTCNAIAGGIFDVAQSTIRKTYGGGYENGVNRFSKRPMALVTRQDDPQWSQLVYWVNSGIFYAEEKGITKDTASVEMPLVETFGPGLRNLFRQSVSAVGNYGEIYARNVEVELPRGGPHDLNAALSGPQFYPLPGFF